MGHTPAMAQNPLDDPALCASMARYLSAATALEEAAEFGGEARTLVDLAEAKAMTGLMLRKRLAELGWSEPVAASTRQPPGDQSLAQQGVAEQGPARPSHSTLQ